MNKVTIDAALQAKFENLEDPLELCDATGRTVAIAVPPDLYERWLYEWAKAEFSDEEELERARQEKESLTTSEAIAFLEQLIREKGLGA
jgi:hypothetical protein